MKYLGREFKNYEEMHEWSKNNHIAEYRELADMFSRNPSMELSILMGDRAKVLVESFDLTWTEIDELETA